MCNLPQVPVKGWPVISGESACARIYLLSKTHICTEITKLFISLVIITDIFMIDSDIWLPPSTRSSLFPTKTYEVMNAQWYFRLCSWFSILDKKKGEKMSSSYQIILLNYKIFIIFWNNWIIIYGRSLGPTVHRWPGLKPVCAYYF